MQETHKKSKNKEKRQLDNKTKSSRQQNCIWKLPIPDERRALGANVDVERGKAGEENCVRAKNVAMRKLTHTCTHTLSHSHTLAETEAQPI